MSPEKSEASLVGEKAPIQAQNAEGRDFQVEELIRSGFTNQLKEFVVQLNAFIQESKPYIQVQTPQPTTRVAEKQCRQ